MEKYIKIYRNWRIHVLAIMAVIGGVLVISDANSVITFILSKVFGLGLVYGCYCLCLYWDCKGKIDELKEVEE